MTVTTKSNVFVPEILADAIRQGVAGKIALYGTGAVTVNFSLPGDKRGGDEVVVPRFTAFANIQHVADGDPVVPAQLVMDSDKATVIQAAGAVEMTRWAQLAAQFADPYAEAARQYTEALVHDWDSSLISVAANATGLPAAQKISIWSATTPKTVDLPALIRAKLAYGDEQDGIAAFVCHADVLGNLYGLNDSQGRPLLLESAREGGLPTVLGIPTIVSNKMPKDVTDAAHPKYTSMFVKKGSLALWVNGNTEVNEFRDPYTNKMIASWWSYYAPFRYPHPDLQTANGIVTLTSN